MLKKIIPHATIVLSLMTLLFFIISRFNDAMAFMTSALSQWLFALLAVCALITAICLISAQWKERKRKEAAARRRRAEQAQGMPNRHPRVRT